MKNIYGISRKAPKVDVPTTFCHLPIDLSQQWDIDLLPKQMDAIIHLAQSEHYRDFPEYAEDTFYTNVASTARLLEYARLNGTKTFVLSSTGGISGQSNNGFNHTENSKTNDNLGFYFGTKLCSEVLARSYAPYMNIIILRFFFVYGPGQKQTMLIPRLIKSVKDRIPIVLNGPSGIRLNPVHVKDAVESIKKAVQLNQSKTINIGGPEVISIKKIAETIAVLVNKPPIFSMQKESVPQDLIADIESMSMHLAPPTLRFFEGIKSLI